MDFIYIWKCACGWTGDPTEVNEHINVHTDAILLLDVAAEAPTGEPARRAVTATPRSDPAGDNDP